MNRIIFLILCVSAFLASCKPNSDNMQTEVAPTDREESSFVLPEWAKSANIYEVNVRQYTEEGTINAFSKHLPRLKEMGVDIIWLMPIYPISETKKKGTLGSYYSVNDFLAINPEFGTMADVDRLIQEIHRLDMKIILDWVPNHTGWDHVWLKSHPEWYTQDSEGNIIDPLNDSGESAGWTDVADLNYDNAEMRAEMIRELKWWVTEKNIDGFRMDIAYGAPDDFWKTVKDSIYPIKDLFMLAESEKNTHRNNDYFHATYGWNLFHSMNAIAKGEKKIVDFEKIHEENEKNFTKGAEMLFTSNHDENAWNGTVFERLGEGHLGWAVVMTLMDGIPLLYSGMEEPMKKRLEFFEKDPIGFEKYEYQDFYKALFELKHQHKALWNKPYGGRLNWLDVHENVIAFNRTLGEDSISVFFNTSDKAVTINSPYLNGTVVPFGLKAPKEMEINNASLQPFEYKVIINN